MEGFRVLSAVRLTWMLGVGAAHEEIARCGTWRAVVIRVCGCVVRSSGAEMGPTMVTAAMAPIGQCLTDRVSRCDTAPSS